jgi:hypothetical protein
VASAFLAQFAAGCLLIVALATMRQCGWKYLRLMAFVSLGLVCLAGALELRERWGVGELAAPSTIALGAGVVLTLVWLVINALQGEAIRDNQRLWPGLAGIACQAAAILLVLLVERPDALLGDRATAGMVGGGSSGASSSPSQGVVAFLQSTGAVVATVLGAGILGAATCAMLLGHRYLTDTDMPMAPLRRLGRVYLGTVIARFAWACLAAAPLFMGYRPSGDVLMFWVGLTARVAVGLVATAIFAYMVWDCIRCRATQSATALFYLSMIFVFIGELAGQYLLRVHGLAL